MSYDTLEVLRRDRQMPLRYGVSAATPAGATASEVPLWLDDRASLENGAAVVASATFVPSVTLATNANNPTLTLAKRTAGGAAVTLATLNLTSTALTAWTPVSMTLTATTANLTLSPGDVLTWALTTNGAGGVNPQAGYVFADITRS